MSNLTQNYSKFTSLTESEWQLIGSKLKIQTLKAGEYWLTEGRICQYVGHLEKGVMRTFYVNNSGKKSTFLFNFPGKPITDFESFINKTPSKYYIECVSDAVIHSINYDDRQFLMEKIPKYERMIRYVTEDYFFTLYDRMVNLTLLSAEERYIRLIKTEPNIFDYLSLSSIAEYINIKPQSLSRIRKKVQEKIN
jgi:CRP-like cAMP-binding protein